MAYLTVPNVQTWLEATKLTVATVESGLETATKFRVIAALSEVYDTSLWLDDTSTPALVRQVMAMYYAAWYYRRTYSEDTDSSPTYADWLEGLADTMLMGIVDGTLDLIEVVGLSAATGSMDFYPQDNNYDSNGYRVDDAKFTMGQVF